MRLKQIIGGLTPAEKSALKVLDESGRWGILYDARIDDGWNADGQKRRTFQRRGRCQLVLMFDTTAKNPATGLFAEPEPQPIPEPQPVAFEAAPVEIAPAPEPPEPQHTRPVAWVEPEVIVKKKKKK